VFKDKSHSKTVIHGSRTHGVIIKIKCNEFLRSSLDAMLRKNTC